MRGLKTAMMAAMVAVALSAPPAVAGEGGSEPSSVEAQVVQSWKQEAQSDPVAAEGLADFQKLTAAEQDRFLDLLHDARVWEKATHLAVAGPGTYRAAPDVEVVVHEPQRYAAAAGDPGSVAPLQLWNVVSTSQVDMKVLGVKLGHWRQEYGYTTKTGQYSIVSSDWCSGWWTGFAGLWNISTSTNHYKSGDFGICKSLHTGSLVFKGSFIQVNKEHGQQVAGPYRIRWWLQNV